MICFANRKDRDDVYHSRTKLKGHGIYINEHLTRDNAKIFTEARRMVTLKSLFKAWTSGGNICVLPFSGAKPVRITRLADLDKFRSV